MEQIPTVPEVAQPLKHSKLSLLLCMIVGFFCVEFLLWGDLMLSYLLFVLASEAVALWAMSRTKQLTKMDILWPIAICALLPMHILTDNQILLFLNAFLLFVLFYAQLAALSGTAKQAWYKPLFIFELIGIFFVRLFSHIPMAFTFDKNKKDRKGRHILLGALAVIPLLIIVMLLLSSADAVFGHYVKEMMADFHLSTTLWKLVLTAICGLLFFSFLAAMGLKMGINFNAPKTKKGLPVSAVITFITGLNLVYLIFCAMQFMYLFGAFHFELPEGISYTNYARDGFFELATIGIINLIVLAVFTTFTKPSFKGKVIYRVTMTILVVTTITMLASAAMRLIMYCDAFGLTRLRVYTLWFLALEVLLIIAMLVRIYYRKFTFLKVGLLVFLVCWLILCYARTDAMIAKVQVDRYIAGEVSDPELLKFLSFDANEELVRLYSYDKDAIDDGTLVIKNRYENITELLKDWKQWSLPRLRARQDLEQFFKD